MQDQLEEELRQPVGESVTTLALQHATCGGLPDNFGKADVRRVRTLVADVSALARDEERIRANQLATHAFADGGGIPGIHSIPIQRVD